MVIFCLFVIFNASAYSIDVNMDPEQAFKVGQQLERQFKDSQALAYLKYAADEGVAESAFLYGMMRRNAVSVEREQTESLAYLQQAAKQGYLPAMKWMMEHSSHPESWRRHYYKALIELGRRSPEKAFYGLADYYRLSDTERYEFYLTQAVERDHPEALIEQATRLSRGADGYLLPSVRLERVEQLLLRAAQTHHVAAMRTYIHWLEEKRRYREAFHWRQEALKGGDILELAELGFIYANPRPNYLFIQRDYSKSNLLLNKYINSAGEDRFQSIYRKVQSVYLKNIEICQDDVQLCRRSDDELSEALNKTFLY